jgi:hypothetical protein
MLEDGRMSLPAGQARGFRDGLEDPKELRAVQSACTGIVRISHRYDIGSRFEINGAKTPLAAVYRQFV